MRSRPRVVAYKNSNYNPFETRVDILARCTVCGFAGIDYEKTQEPEKAVFTQVVTGTVYQIPVGTPVEGLGIVDKDVFTQVGAYSGCPF
jgi:hypothetical protein